MLVLYVEQELHIIHKFHIPFCYRKIIEHYNTVNNTFICQEVDTNKQIVTSDNKGFVFFLNPLLLPGEQRKRVLGRRNNKSIGIIQDNTWEIRKLALSTHENVLLPQRSSSLIPTQQHARLAVVCLINTTTVHDHHRHVVLEMYNRFMVSGAITGCPTAKLPLWIRSEPWNANRKLFCCGY